MTTYGANRTNGTGNQNLKMLQVRSYNTYFMIVTYVIFDHFSLRSLRCSSPVSLNTASMICCDNNPCVDKSQYGS